MSYSVNLGCWGSIFAVPTDVVDKYLKIAGSAQLKVLLWILRHSGEEFEPEVLAKQLNMDTFDVNDCLEFWISFNIIKKDGNVISPASGTRENSFANDIKPIAQPVYRTAQPIQAVNPSQPTISKASQSAEMPPQKAVQSTADNSTPAKQEPLKRENQKQPPIEKIPVNAADDKPSATVVARPLRPDPVYVAKRMSDDKEIEFLLNEAQYILGRPISHNENAGLIMLHDNDGLPCEVILMLLTYGVSNQKGMKQIEALGSLWAKDGVYTVQAAEEKIRELDQSKEAWHKVQSILGLEFRKPSQKEEETSNRWINEWKFSEEMIKEAYDICVNAKGKYIPNYVNTVLNSWYTKGITTVEQVRAERTKSPQKTNNSNTNGRKSSFDIDDLKNLSMFND